MPRPFSRTTWPVRVGAILAALAAPAFGDDVPKGDVTKYSFESSKIFPGTVRDYWVYVPRQYDPAKPACVHVNQDGIQYNAPAVFDRLIHEKAMPVTIGVFVMHGRVKAPNDRSLDRFNRSFEYDGLGDAYARFLLEELLPDVESKTAPDGRPIRLSKEGNDRAIGGSSSGAIAAFTAAWERPDAFRRVFSAIGTYVGLRGGDVYPTLIRKYEPKPLRVFLEDGSNDLNIYGGDWWMANQAMERALTFAGYEVAHDWGDGGHNARHATEIFPDAVKWLWKDWPAPIQAGPGSQQLREILVPGEGWQLVGEGYRFTEGPAANAQGDVYFNDIPANTTYKVSENGKPEVVLDDSKGANGQMFSADGRRFAVATATEQVLAYDANGEASVVAKGFRGNDLVIRHDGGLYVTNPSRDPAVESKLWFIDSQGKASVVDSGLKFTNGVTLSPDQSLLYVAESRSRWVYSYQVQADGTLAHKQKYYHLHVPDVADDAGADGIRVDRDGRLYVATRMGVQVCDQAGRVNCIIPTPNGRVSNVCFGGPNFDTLYATCGDKVYRRKLKVRGIAGFEPPSKPSAPRL
ncbi:MAG: SMP-30/gluconolactonase/LRE family protein [Isosphaeraceae bacterium]